jgi:uncharacterized protein YceK
MKAARYLLKIVLTGMLCFICSGCATIVSRGHDKYGVFHDKGIYPATRLEAEIIGYGVDSFSSAAVFAGAIVDFPLSLVFDTLLLPYDYIKEGD